MKLFNDYQNYNCLMNAARLHTLTRAVAMLFAIALVSGCAVTAQKARESKPVEPAHVTIDPAVEHASPDTRGWWQIGFHRQFETNDEVQWQYDTLVALKVIKPIIDSVQGIELWRFHRRAIQDSSGHKFSFIFYATRAVGEDIYQAVVDQPLVKQLLNNSHINRLSFYDINKPLREDIEIGSDSSWPPELQKTWPHFIMGVSQTWLGLVNNYYQQLEVNEEAGLDDQLEAFEEVSTRLNDLWKYYGSHAFLHHLNALFAYQQLYIIERRLGNF